jgi:enoyl-CoA hydratase
MGGVSIVTLNRPEALNVLSGALTSAIGNAFAALQACPETRVSVLTGAGQAFCAGMDMKELASGTAKLQDIDEIEGAGHRRFGMNVFREPIIAAINGFAITGGLELALCCDIRIASTTAKSADTHSRVGVVPGGRMSALLPCLIGLGHAKEMCLGGNPIDAAAAERQGLVNQVVEP